MKLVHLAADDFDRLAAGTKMGEDARQMARSVLVSRQSLPNVAAQYNVTKQRVYLAVESIRKEYAKSKQHSGWIGVDLELPHSLASDLERLAATLRAQPNEGVRQDVLIKLSRALASAEHSLR